MKPEYDTERIGTIISDIERYRSDLRDLHIGSVNDLDDKRSFYAASMILFALLNRTIDLGNEIILAHGFGIPSTYREIFSILEKEGVIKQDLAKKIMHLVFYRNLLSHEYHGIDRDKIFQLIGRVDDIRIFTGTIQKYIQGT
jgi:uncharacterized protein YutE (UPF0331/DUF86 family)